MSNFFSSLATFCLLSLTYSSVSSACGGGILSEEQILNSVQVTGIQEKFEKLLGEKLVLSSLVKAENKILGFDQEVVASFLCNSNNVFVYFSSSNGTVCVHGMDIVEKNQISIDYFIGRCRLANGDIKILKKRN